MRRARVFACMCVCSFMTRKQMHKGSYTCTDTLTHTDTHKSYYMQSTCRHTNSRRHRYIDTPTRRHADTPTRTHARTHAHTHTHTYTYTHIHTHTHTYSLTHENACRCVCIIHKRVYILQVGAQTMHWHSIITKTHAGMEDTGQTQQNEATL